jgi:hypothetical protein
MWWLMWIVGAVLCRNYNFKPLENEGFCFLGGLVEGDAGAFELVSDAFGTDVGVF